MCLVAMPHCSAPALPGTVPWPGEPGGMLPSANPLILPPPCPAPSCGVQIRLIFIPTFHFFCPPSFFICLLPPLSFLCPPPLLLHSQSQWQRWRQPAGQWEGEGEQHGSVSVAGRHLLVRMQCSFPVSRHVISSSSSHWTAAAAAVVGGPASNHLRCAM